MFSYSEKAKENAVSSVSELSIQHPGMINQVHTFHNRKQQHSLPYAPFLPPQEDCIIKAPLKCCFPGIPQAIWT